MKAIKMTTERTAYFVTRPVNTHLSAAFDLKKHRLQNMYHEYNKFILGRRARWANKMGAQLETANFKMSNAIAVL